MLEMLRGPIEEKARRFRDPKKKHQAIPHPVPGVGRSPGGEEGGQEKAREEEGRHPKNDQEEGG
ncbi:MAG: hypothetical protein AAF800_00560 [Planctomycetota bacterium]